MKVDLDPAAGRRSVADVLISLLCANAFQIEVAEPLLQGAFLAAASDDAFPNVRSWVSRIFQLGQAGEDYSSLFADVLESPRISRGLRSAPLAWSPEGLARALRRSSSSTTPAPFAALRDQLLFISRGLADLQISGEPARGEGLDGWRLGEDVSITFSIDAALEAQSIFCRLDLGVISPSSNPVGSLILDYGEGNVVDILLSPRGRSLYSAFICIQGLLHASWKPDSASSTVTITRLTASAIAVDALKALLLTTSTEANVNRFAALADLLSETGRPPRAALDVSRMLTRHVGGHVVLARDYASWIRIHEPAGALAEAGWRAKAEKIDPSLIITLVMILTADCEHEEAHRSIASLKAQIFPSWRLLLFDLRDSDPADHGKDCLILPDDHRLHYFARPALTAAEALNAGLALVEGPWLMRASVGDTLAPQALLEAAGYIGEKPGLQLIYLDEDVVDRQGKRRDPHFKPDFSPDLLLAQNYVGNHALHATANVRRLAGWRTDLVGGEDYDLLLRATEGLRAGEIGHVANILYHKAEPKAPAHGSGTEARSAALALTSHLSRTGFAASVETLPSGDRRVRPTLPSPTPKVSLIIPTRDKVGILQACVASILSKTTYPNYEIIIVDNNSVEPETLDFFQEIEQQSNVSILKYPSPFNYSKINNFAVSMCHGDVVGLVNNDTEVISPDWIEELAGWACLETHGCIGAMLYFSDDRIQHAGVILGVGGVAGHSHKYYQRGDAGYASRLQVHQNLSAVTGACLFVRTALYRQVGGLDEGLSVAFNDVDLCLKIRALGYRNIFTPYAELYHHESLSRGTDENSDRAKRFFSEFQAMHRRWGDDLLTDPFYSKNLSLIKEDFDLRWKDD